MKIRIHRLRLLVLLCPAILLGQAAPPGNNAVSDGPIPVLIRCDDVGMCHAVNMAVRQVIESGFPVSVSVMFACPWYQEAVELLRQHPEVSVGIHLTLNAEWKNYRWGPVSGCSAVPSLVDSLGYFFSSRAQLFGNNPRLEEIETELRAQIERAKGTGLRIDYLDHHMSAAVQTPETRAILEKLAAEYHLAISRYFGEVASEHVYAAPVEHKRDSLLALTRSLQPGETRLLVFHVGIDTPELSALQDLNPFGPKEMSKHRQAELDALLSSQFQTLIHQPGFRLVNYRQLISERGLEVMRRPAE